MEAENEGKKLSIVYTTVPNKPTISASGAFGGPLPDSNGVVAHFFIEHHTIPSISTHPILPDGTVNLSGEGSNPIKRGDVTREVQASMLLSPEAAVSIGEWLADHGRKAIDRRSAKPPKPPKSK